MDLKPKHHSLAATIILLISVIAGLGYAAYHFQSITKNESVGSGPIFSEVSVPTSKEMHTMSQLKTKLRNLSIPKESMPGPVALEIFGYRQPVFNTKETSNYTDDSPKQLSYALTFTFSSGSRRFCIIDGIFYPKGATLPDGAQIVQIEAHKVLIRKKDRQKWIPLEIPANTIENQTISQKPSKKADVGG